MIKSKPLPPLERLFEVFEYDNLGRLFWREKPSKKVNIAIGDEITTVGTGGYKQVMLDRKRHLIHRIIWAMANRQDPGGFEIDHINRDRSDNRPQNLRLATQEQNAQNTIYSPRGRTGELCIFPSPARCKNKPHTVVVCGRYLGAFATLEDARKARDEYRASIRTEFSPA